MDWLSQGSLISDGDLRTLMFSDVRPSCILSLVKPKERPLKTEMRTLSTEGEWNEWLSQPLPNTVGQSQSAMQILLCRRAKKRFSDPLILANLPFPKSLFERIKTGFRIHQSIIRVINRNTSCTFIAFPTTDSKDDQKDYIVYNCRTASTWPGDLATSVSFFPQTLATYAVVYGCDEHHLQILIKRLAECGHDVLHPMLLPTLLAEIERDRHVSMLRQNVNKTVQRIYDLTVNRKHLMGQNDPPESSSSDSTQEHSVIAWLEMNYLKNGLQNWQQQIRKMVTHIDDMNTVRGKNNNLETTRIGCDNLAKLESSELRIRQRLQELVDEYDEHIRECSTVINGLSLATSTEVRHSNERVAFSTLVVSRLTQRDGNLMKSIALLTMIYLPVTFSSTFFSMDFFHWPGSTDSIVTPYIWVCAIVAVVLTALTVGVFVAFNVRKTKSLQSWEHSEV